MSEVSQEPVRGLLRLILHFALFVWLQLLVSLFWDSSSCNSLERRQAEAVGGENPGTSPLENLVSVHFK